MTAVTVLLARWTSDSDLFESRFGSPHEGVSLARELQQTLGAMPAMVEFGRLDDASPVLAIGLGRPRSVVTFQASLDPPYFISLASDQRVGTICFVYAQEDTEYSARNSVPIEAALDALLEFLTTAGRPHSIDWERL